MTTSHLKRNSKSCRGAFLNGWKVMRIWAKAQSTVLFSVGDHRATLGQPFSRSLIGFSLAGNYAALCYPDGLVSRANFVVWPAR